MGLVTMTLATAIAGTSSVPYSAAQMECGWQDIWVLPSESIDRSYHTISISYTEYNIPSALEAVMREAVLSSTEHRYDL